MLIHYLMLFIVFILALIYRKKRDKLKDKSLLFEFLLIFIFFILTLFLGLRNVNVGTDTHDYVLFYLNKIFEYDNFEIILQLIIIGIRFFTDKYWIYLTILAFICLIGIYFNAKKYKFDTEYFLFLYITSFCYLYATSAIRFFCAFSIIMLTFQYMIKKDTKKVIILTLLASMFHTTALIFIPIYFLIRFKFTKSKLYIYSLGLILLVLLEEIIGLEFLFQINILSKYKYVLENQNNIGGLSALMNIGIFIFAMMYYKQITIYKEDYEFFIKIHIIGTMLDFIDLSYRVIWYFRFPVWFIIPIILVNIKSKNKNHYYFLYLIFMIIYSIMYYFLLKNSLHTHNLLNYTFNNALN